MTIQNIGFLAFVLFAALGIWVYAKNWFKAMDECRELEKEIHELEVKLAFSKAVNEDLTHELAKAQAVNCFLKMRLDEAVNEGEKNENT